MDPFASKKVRRSSCIYDLTRPSMPNQEAASIYKPDRNSVRHLSACLWVPRVSRAVVNYHIRGFSTTCYFQKLRQGWCGHRALQRPATSPAASYKMRMEANMKALVYDDALDVPNAGQCHDLSAKLSSLITMSVMPIICLQTGRLENPIRHVLSNVLITG